MLENNKILYILRGPSGIGKSTYAINLDSKVFSTDDFFIDKKGNYIFSKELLACAHLWNYIRTLNALVNNEQRICIDNTNIELWEMKDYVIAAQEYNYNIKIIEFDIPKKITSKDLFERSKHNVPIKTIEKMLINYPKTKNPTIKQILKSKRPADK